MKKISFFAATLLAIAGCQTDKLQNDSLSQRLITHSFTIESEDANVKSYFDPTDEYVKLTKEESIAVGYASNDEALYYTDEKTGVKSPKIEGIVEATRSGDTYSFSHNAIDKSSTYNYYFVMPYRDNKNISLNSVRTSMYVKLDAVQHPTPTSFDPLQDYVIGQPIIDATEQQASLSSSKLKLKRIFALVRVTLRDGQNLLGGAPLKSASIGFPETENSDKKNNLVSLVYLKPSETFSEAGPSGYANIDTPHVSPTVTAEYAEGLSPKSTDEGNTYTVWYVTLPVEKQSGTELTVTVQSDEKKVTRTINLPKDMKLTAGVINDISINFSAEGCAEENLVDENDYWSIYNAGQDIAAGGLTINKSKYSNATLLSGDQVTQANLQKGGLIFVEDDWTSTAHLKLAKGTIIIGRYKDKQPSISMTSSHAIYLDNGDIILKNLNIGGTSSAGRLLVMSSSSASTFDYAVVEDCSITAPKNVCGYSSGTPTSVIKNLSFINCIIKLAGTDANYVVINISKLSAKDTDSSVYKKIEKFEISNCVIYAEQPYPYSDTKGVPTRRMLMDLGSGASGEQYDFPLENAKIVVSNNTLYNINTNGGVLARAYYCKSAEVDGNVVYIDYSSFAETETFKASYMFGIYSGLNNANNGTYSIDNNYSYGYHTDVQSTYITSSLSGNTVKWKYRKTDYSPDYTTTGSKQENGTNQNYPFTTVDINKGYFPVNSSNIKNATGASYDTKYWVK